MQGVLVALEHRQLDPGVAPEVYEALQVLCGEVVVGANVPLLRQEMYVLLLPLDTRF